MLSFERNKRHLRELLIYFFNLKKSAAEAHRLLVETYGEAALSERSCRVWFQKFKNGEFDIEDKERSGRTKVYKYAGLEALLDQNSCSSFTINAQFFHKRCRKLICTPNKIIYFFGNLNCSSALTSYMYPCFEHFYIYK